MIDATVDSPAEGQEAMTVPDQKCWEMRSNCVMKDEPRENASCPAYRDGVGCWEVDWKLIVEMLPASQRVYWLLFLNNCENCVVYKSHSTEMKARIDAVSAVIFAD